MAGNPNICKGLWAQLRPPALLCIALPLYGLAIALLCFSSVAHAQEEQGSAAQSEADDDEPIDLGSSKITVHVEPEDEEVPLPEPIPAEDEQQQAVEVSLVPQPALELSITAEQIEQSGAANLAELLRSEPGFILSEFFGGTELSYQGLPAKFTGILIDGQRVPGHVLERADMGQLPLGTVERIEVIRGPQTAAHGPDNAAVIINIITKSGSSGSELALGAGSLGYNSQRISTGGGDDDSSWFVSGSRSLRGSYDFNGNNIDTDGDSTRQYELFAKYRRDFGDDSLALQLDWFSEDSTGLSSSPPSLERHSDTTTRRLHAAFSYEWSLGCEESLRLEQSLGSYHHKLERYFVGFEDEEQQTGFTEQLADTRLHYRGSLGEVAIRAGAEHNQDRIDSDRVSGSGVREAQVSAGYLSGEWQASRALKMSAALRYDEHSSFGGQLTPRVAAEYRLDDNSSLSAGIGRGYRSPSLRELYFDFDSPFGYSVIGNEALRPETRWSANLDYNYQRSDFSFALSGFRHEVEDLIDFVEIQSAPQVFESQNIASVSTMGLSLSTEKRFALQGGYCSCGAQPGAHWGLGYDATWLPEAKDGELGTRLINSAELDQRLRLFYGRDDLDAEVALRLVGERFTDRNNTIEAPSYETVDVTLRRRAGRGEWRLAGLNILDERDSRFGPEPGRELRMQYVLEF